MKNFLTILENFLTALGIVIASLLLAMAVPALIGITIQEGYRQNVCREHGYILYSSAGYCYGKINSDNTIDLDKMLLYPEE